jgi:CubicO group peptidase (beta-lactamase class C family)
MTLLGGASPVKPPIPPVVLSECNGSAPLTFTVSARTLTIRERGTVARSEPTLRSMPGWFGSSLTTSPPAPPLDGFVHPDFLLVADALARQLRQYDGGAGVCVYHHGVCVVDLWGGYRDGEGHAWQRDTMSPSFSTTKGVVSTVVHIMVDRGLLDYEARVADYWPEFAQNGKADITVRHVLAHQSGLYHIRQIIDRADRMLDWAYMVRAIERAEPVHPPGMHTGYHGLTYGFLVGELIQRVTGKHLSEVVREVIAEPLGLDGLYIGTPVEQLHRAAKLIWPRGNVLGLGARLLRWQGPRVGDALAGSAALVQRLLDLADVQFDLPSILDGLVPRGISAFDFGAEECLRVAIPAANGLFTARSLARMYAALACGGALDGVRLLSRATLARATEVQATASRRRLVVPFDMHWRLGWHGVITSRGVPKHAFGHFGFGGSGAWADPRRELAVALIVNCGMGTPFGDLRIARLSGAVLGCANARARSTARDETAVPAAPLDARLAAER